MKRWLAVAVVGVVLALVPAAQSLAGGNDDATGLTRACSNASVEDMNQNCPEYGGDRPPKNNGGSPPNEAGPTLTERVASCADDRDGDGKPDGCNTGDSDADGVPNQFDNCADAANNNQSDGDGDGIGDACDPYADDADHDGVPDPDDNCPNAPKGDQRDVDRDGAGDPCDGDDGSDSGPANGVPDAADPTYAAVHAQMQAAVQEVTGRLPQP